METKTFDCVAMKGRGAEAVQERLRGMSEEEARRFWRDRTEALRKRQTQEHDADAASQAKT